MEQPDQTEMGLEATGTKTSDAPRSDRQSDGRMGQVSTDYPKNERK